VLAAARSSSEPVIGAACRFVPVKGLIYLLRAVALLRAQVCNFRVEIAGQGPEFATLKHESASLRLNDCVTFLGWQPNLAPMLTKWDLFIQPSLDEGFGIGILEAMAAGLPVVASRTGGIPELVADGHTGWLVPPRNPSALADRMRLLLAQPHLRTRMGAAGKARVRAHFCIVQMASRVSAIYDAILAGRRTRCSVHPGKSHLFAGISTPPDRTLS
jgi:glycosyltransferase involved in cell wall biosynthesis